MKPSSVETNTVGVPEFDAMDDAAAEALLRLSCGSERWIAYLVRKRPHRTVGQLLAASDDAVRLLDWPDIEQALAPLALSWERSVVRRKDAGRARPSSTDLTRITFPQPAEVRTATAEYQQRFGHAFLTSSPGGSANEIVHQLQIRLEHATDVERRVVRAELRKIIRLRLTTTFSSLDGV